MTARDKASQIAAEASKKISPRTYVATEVRDLGRSDLERIAVEFILLQVKRRARGRSLEVEREAETPAGLPQGWTNTGNGWAIDESGVRVEHPDWALVHEQRRRKAEADDLISAYVERTHLELNAKLLMSRFARGDGTEVSWGEATIEDHETRFEMYRANVVADAEGAARHRRAIVVISEAQASCLNEVAKVTAVAS